MESSDKIIKTLTREFLSLKVGSRKLSSSKFGHDSLPSSRNIHENNRIRMKKIISYMQAAVESESLSPIMIGELRDLQHITEDVIEEIEFDSIQAPKLAELYHKLPGRQQQQEVDLLLDSVNPKDFKDKIDNLINRYRDIESSWPHVSCVNKESYKCTLSTRGTRGLLHGRESELKELRKYLLSGNSWDVVSVVGMSGIGKTALLQHFCKDERVRAYFNRPIWICASNGFDETKITRTIIQHFGGDLTNQNDLSLLQDALEPCLSGKRVLLVIDDVWIGNGNSAKLTDQWDNLLNSLKNAGASKESKVVLTTQERKTAVILGSEKSLTLSGLSDDSCFKICKEWAVDRREQDVKEIAKMCNGLPLAAKAVGRFLKRENDQQWDNLLQSIWRGIDQETQNEILDHLKRAYYRLPPYLKQCFTYCSLFPKGYIFEKEYLVQLWVGQGFIKKDAEKMSVNVGRVYFDQLVQRSLFQSVDDHGTERFVMNDFLRELARCTADEGVLRIDGTDSYRLLNEINEGSTANEGISRIKCYGLPDINEEVRHLSLSPPKPNSEILLQCKFEKSIYLRSVLYIDVEAECSFRIRVSNEFIFLIKSLRVLDLSHTNLRVLPSSVIYLIHLRYLSLARTKIEMLPESISGLFKLQTLDLKYCSSLKDLPETINLLSNLHTLELSKHYSCGIPDGFEEIACDEEYKKWSRKQTTYVS